MDKDPNGKCPNVRWQGLGYQDKAKNNKLRISLKKKTLLWERWKNIRKLHENKQGCGVCKKNPFGVAYSQQE